jgi:hypothetical protein
VWFWEFGSQCGNIAVLLPIDISRNLSSAKGEGGVRVSDNVGERVACAIVER